MAEGGGAHARGQLSFFRADINKENKIKFKLEKRIYILKKLFGVEEKKVLNLILKFDI